MLETLPAFSVKNMSLVDFCALFSELSTVPVSIDADAPEVHASGAIAGEGGAV